MDALLSNETIWYLVRASGVVAYLFLAASTIWGLLLTSRLLKDAVPAPLSLAMHNYLSWNAIGLTVIHAVLLLFSSHLDYTVLNLLIPFTGPYNPGWVGAGIIGLYLMILTSVTFYMLRRIGQKAFRAIHYLSYAAFTLSLLHGWFAGTDTAALETVYLVTGLGVFFLTAYRVLITLPVRQGVSAEQVASGR